MTTIDEMNAQQLSEAIRIAKGIWLQNVYGHIQYKKSREDGGGFLSSLPDWSGDLNAAFELIPTNKPLTVIEQIRDDNDLVVWECTIEGGYSGSTNENLAIAICRAWLKWHEATKGSEKCHNQ